MSRYFILLAAALLATASPAGAQPAGPRGRMAGVDFAGAAAAQQVSRVRPSTDAQLRRVETGDREFTRLSNPMVGVTSYYHGRTIGMAEVEGDFIRYKFDVESGELMEEARHWRDGLPETASPAVSRLQAEAMVTGQVVSTSLVFIAPGSPVYPVYPAPENPCWIVRARNDGELQIHMIDAMTGERLGMGIPPPSEGLSIHGPDWGGCPQDAIWYSWAENARSWFSAMGYSATRTANPYDSEIMDHIQSDEGVLFYELAHGGATSFHNRCDAYVYATEVAGWIDGYASMGFTFIGSCEGLCNTGTNTFTPAFTAGLSTDTAVAGYCGMDASLCVNDCWSRSISWQNAFFGYLNDGYDVGSAWAMANLDVPDCADDNHNCMRVAGDLGLVIAGPGNPLLQRSVSGAASGMLGPVADTATTRAHHLRDAVTVPGGETLSIPASASLPYNELVFTGSGGTLAADGALSVDAADGEAVTIATEDDRDPVVVVRTGGEIKATAGGGIKVGQ